MRHRPADRGRITGSQLDADLLLVTDSAGAVLVGEYESATAGELPAVAEGLKGREAAASGHIRAASSVVTVPIAVGVESPEILGTLSVGFLLDDRRAAQFRRATASEDRVRGRRTHPRRDPAGRPAG